MRAKDSLEILFPNMRTRKASRLFIDWLKTNNDIGPFYATKNAVSRFADSLQLGIIDSDGNKIKFSRVNFYGTILKTLIEGGFLQKDLAVYDSVSSRTLWVYAPHIFNIPKEPPAKGFWRLAYYICKKWNKLFSYERAT